ncbi:hypothetical protein ABPG72_005541 [Tetrahymena utriculariae]
MSSDENTPLVDTEVDPVVYKAGRIKVVVLGLTFLLLFSAFSSAQNLVGSLYKGQGYNNLGLISLLVLYAIFAFCCLFANFFFSRMQYKYIFIFSSLGYVSYTAAGIWVCACDGSGSLACSKGIIYFIVLFGSSLCGFSASLIWIAQGGYIDSIGQDTPSKKGTFSGIFWAITQGSQIIGNILGTFILQYLQNIQYFFIMTGLGIAASLLFFFLPSVKKVENKDIIVPIMTQIKNVFKLMIHAKTRYVLFVMMLSGIILTFYSGFLSTLVDNSIAREPNQSDDDFNKVVSKKLSFTLICLGCFEVVSGLISGRLGDKFNVFKLATFGTLICFLGVLLSFLGLFTDNYFVCFIIASVWGFSDCYFQTVIQTLINKLFPGQIEIFQVFRFVLSITVAIFQVINILLQDSPAYIFLMITMFCIMVTNFACAQLGKNDQGDNVSIQSSQH